MNEALILPASRALPRNTTNDSATLCAHFTEYIFLLSIPPAQCGPTAAAAPTVLADIPAAGNREL
jgi:hypothetical protein